MAKTPTKPLTVAGGWVDFSDLTKPVGVFSYPGDPQFRLLHPHQSTEESCGSSRGQCLRSPGHQGGGCILDSFSFSSFSMWSKNLWFPKTDGSIFFGIIPLAKSGCFGYPVLLSKSQMVLANMGILLVAVFVGSCTFCQNTLQKWMGVAFVKILLRVQASERTMSVDQETLNERS